MSNQIVISSGAKVRELEGVLTGTSGIVSSVPLGGANGVATLDSGGKVPVSQLPSSVVTYLGTWNAATNTPTLVNGTGDAGDMYICNVAGTVNFGAGPVTFAVGDWVLYGSGTWEKSNGQNGTVTSVAASITGDSIGITGSPIVSAGTLAFAFSGTNLQYVNGAGNLTTFPTLTGFVPYTGATANVDLGVYDLTADLITGATGSFASNGGSDTFAINHSSGGGIALNITKGGSGEGLYINKTSGSGNAATIIGTLEATTLVKSGGTSSQFLKADGTVDSNTYALDSLVVKLAGTQTITGAKTFSAYTTFTSTVDITSGLTFSNSGFTLVLQPPTLSVNRTVTLPNGTGTLALTSDISYPVTSVFGRTGAIVATSGDYTTAQVTESGNLYYTDTRARLALSFAAGSGAYNNTTGVITIPTNNNQITNGAGYITGNQTITLSGDVSGSGTTAITTTIGALKVTNAMLAGSIDLTTKVTGLLPDGNISSAATWNAKQNAITLTTTGTSGAATLVGATLNIPQYTDAYTGTVTSVAALTIGTTGTDLSSSVANSTTTPVITLNVPTASATNRGALSSADWTTFNNKQSTITLTTTGTSGVATLIANTLNIPNYGSALSGYLPLTGGTLTGALSGTSATFSLAMTSKDVYITNSANADVLEIFQSPSVLNSFIDYPSGRSLNLRNKGTAGGLTLASTGAATFSSTVRVNGGELTVYSGASIMYTGVDTGNSYAYIGTNTTSYGLSFQASGERMRIFSTGNISISSSPTDAGYKLDVNGTGRFSGQITNSLTGQSTIGLYLNSNQPSGINWYDIDDNEQYSMGIIANSGNGYWGLWSSTSSTAIDRSTATPIFKVGRTGAATFSSSVTASAFIPSGATVPTNGMYLSAANTLNFATNTTNRLSIASTGAATFCSTIRSDATNGLALGSVAGYRRLQYDLASTTFGFLTDTNSVANIDAGSAAFNNNVTIISPSSSADIGTTGQLKISSSTGVTSPASDIYLQAVVDSATPGDRGTAFVVQTGRTSGIAERFRIASTGAATFSSTCTATGFFESSDSRLKTLIEDNYQTKGIASITPKLYTKNGKVELGYYAQDFVGILDSAVSKGSDDMLSLSYREVLVAKVYALEQEIKELKAKLN